MSKFFQHYMLVRSESLYVRTRDVGFSRTQYCHTECIRLSTIGNVSCTMQYTLYRRACRRVFPIGNVLRKTVPRRTVFSTDDGVTTRFCSFSSLLLLRAAKNTVILLLFYFSVKLIAIAIANSTFIILHYIHNVTIS